MLIPRKAQPFFIQVWDLFLIELTNWRWTWRSMVVLGMLTPLGSLVGLKLLLANASREDFSYVFAGNIVLSLMFESQIRVGTHLVFMRFRGMLEYFGSLPVRKYSLMLALFLAFFVLSLPSIAVLLLVGSLVLGQKLVLSPLVLIVVPLCSLCMVGLGALVGVMARTNAEADSLGVLGAFVNAGLGAILIPPSHMPLWLTKLSWISPAAYARSAIRQTVLGPVTERLGLDLALLLFFGGLTFWIVAEKLDWRVN